MPFVQCFICDSVLAGARRCVVSLSSVLLGIVIAISISFIAGCLIPAFADEIIVYFISVVVSFCAGVESVFFWRLLYLD